MAELQINPAAFTPLTTTEPQQQANPGVTNGGVATENQRPDAVVQNIEDLVDLNTDENGRNNLGADTDREAAEQTATTENDVTVRLDYDIEERQLYVDFVDPRTNIILSSVPRREAFEIDARTLDRTDQVIDDGVNDGRIEPEPFVPAPVEQREVPDTARPQADFAPPAVATPAPAQQQVAGRTVATEDAPSGGSRAQIVDDVVPEADFNPTNVAGGTREQVALLEDV